ncbi:hypothetical protein J437_LFUL018048, partial [Ladona fulva]
WVLTPVGKRIRANEEIRANEKGIRNKQQEVIDEMSNRNIDIAIFGVKKSEMATDGVSILLRKKLKNKIISWEPIN